MSDTWFRGEATGGPVSKPGGSIHDLGDGTYLTDRFDVAKQYAQTRSSDPAKQVVLTATIDVSGLRVLDLRTDRRWAQYFEGPGGKQALDIIKTGRMNEFYGESFENFLRHNKINRNNYDVIIGPEYVRGGNQLCIVHKDGQPTPLVAQVRASFKVVTIAPANTAQTPLAGKPLPLGKPDLSGTPKSGFGRAMRNQNAAAVVGMALGGLAQWLGDKGIQRRIEEDLLTKHNLAVDAILARGEGVLVIIHMQEWEMPDFNGMRARAYLGLSVQGGRTQDEAKQNWQRTPRLLQGPAKGWRPFDTYTWIPAE